MSNGIQVKAGWWRQRCGDIVHVWREDEQDRPWHSNAGEYYNNGREWEDSESVVDLVEYLGETDPTLRPPAQLEPVLSICEAIPDDRRELIRRFAVAILSEWATTMADAEPEVTE